MLRNLVIMCGCLIFAITVNAATSQSTELQSPIPHKTEVASDSATGLVNINSADATTLQSVKGFGKKKSEAVVEYRSKNGPFKSVEDLLKIKSRGISKKWLDKISKSLTV